MRLITLSDGTSMGDSLIVFETDAPIEELERLCGRAPACKSLWHIKRLAWKELPKYSGTLCNRKSA